MPSIAALLSAARRRSFVGRERETELFAGLLEQERPEFILLYIHGPGGQGKTTLAKHLTDLCTERQVNHLLVDARDIEPHPVSFLVAVQAALNKLLQASAPADSSAVYEAMAALSGRTVLFIDTYEKIAPLDDWIRLDFMPQLPSNVLTVITGRQPPTLSWTTDGGWRMLMRTLPLRNFMPPESEEYLRRRHLPEDKLAPIIDFTHGHPLALSVVADIYEQFPDKNFSPDQSPDVVRTLLQLFVRQVPSPMHRAAMEVCALVNLLTESLLAEVMGVEDVSELFNWLCSLSFISIGRDGIYPHDITREALCADLRWRHPDWNAELHKRIRHYFHRKLRETTGEGQRKILFDLLYLHRLNAVVKPFFDWQESGSFWVDLAQASDLPVLRDFVLGLEGPDSLAAFDFWAVQPAAQLWVWRDGARQANAFVLKINVHELGPQPKVADPAVQQVLAYQARHLHLRQGEQMVLFRFWMAKDSHQGISPLQSSIFLTIVQYYFTPGLAVSMLAVSQPGFWKPAFAYADLQHLPELDFSVNGRSCGWYARDWRIRSPLAWLELLGKRETDAEAASGAELEQPGLQVLVLSAAEFADHLAEAFKHFHNTVLLQQNPLIRSKLIVQECGSDTTDSERITALKEKIVALLKDLESSPIDGKYHRVLYRTFINPVGSQEKTADFLNMSFSTYRRYLQAGVQRVTELMWAKELE